MQARVKSHWIFLFLVLTCGAAAAQTLAGTVGQGTATVATAGGARSAPITVSAAARGYCKVELALGGGALTAVAQGGRASVHGPARLARELPLPLDPRLGCPLLPRPGAPSTLAWRFRGQAATISYNGQTVTVSVAGGTRLSIVYEQVGTQAFTAADFALPPPPRSFPQRKPAGGGE